PFKGATVLDTLEQVRSEEPVPPRQLQPKLPRDLETICLKCLEKDPRRRYADADRLADDLSAFLDGRPIQARPVRFLEQIVKWPKRRPQVAAVAGVIAVIVPLAFALVGWQWHGAVSARRDEESARRRAEKLVVRTDLQRGRELGDRGEIGRGMLFYARTLESV